MNTFPPPAPSSPAKERPAASKGKIQWTETNSDYTLVVPKPSLKYVDFFLSLDCAGALAATGFYPSCKEISETIGVFEAARHRLKLHYGRSDVLAVAVGDGVWPRTALYAAYLSQWSCVSVDPLLRLEHPKVQKALKEAKRLQAFAEKVEDISLDAQGFSEVVFLFVHSHASLRASVACLKNAQHARIHAINMPCCFGDDLGLEASEIYDDSLVLSARREIQVYRDFSPN
jgi:hypothetical protein